MTTSDRRTARIVGWLYLGTFLFSIPGWLLYGTLLDDPLGGGRDTQIALGAFLEILTAICNVGTAVALYPLARRYAHGLALGYVAVRILEATVIVIGIVSVLSVLSLREQAGDTEPIAHALVAFHDWTMLLGPGFCAAIGNGLLLGLMMFHTGLLPRRVAALGLVGGTLALAAATGALFGVYELQSPVQGLLTVPEMIWELTFGIYLITKGFAPRAARRHAAPSPAAPIHASVAMATR